MRALPVQRHEAFRHACQVELAVADLLDVTDFEIGDVARDDGAAECAQALGGEEAHEADAPLRQEHHHRAPAHPAEHHPATDANLLFGLQALQLAELALLLGWEKET